MLRQLTIRGVDDDLERVLRKLAERDGASLSRTAINLMRKGAGLASGPRPIGRKLRAHFGTWTKDEAREFEEAIKVFDEIDDELRESPAGGAD